LSSSRLEREPPAAAPRGQRGERLGAEQPLLGALVGLLQVEARRVDSPQHVLDPAAQQLTGPRGDLAGLQGRHVLAVLPDREGRAGEATLELLAPGRHFGLDAPVIGAVAEHDLVHPGALQARPKPFEQTPHPRFGVVGTGDVGELAVVVELLEREHRAAVRRDPVERDAEIVHLVAQPAREHEAVDPEAGEDLRQLERVAEAVGQVPRRRGTTSEPLAYGAADQQVADQRLAADQELVGQHVTRTDLDPPGGDQRPQPRLVLGSDREVVLEHDRLPVERERREGGVALERVEHLVDDAAEHQPKVLEGAIPLAVPVGMGHDEVAIDGHGHRWRPGYARR
jgi:hypothetical protein